MNRVYEILNEGIKEGVYPGAVLLVARRGSVVFLHEVGHLSLRPEKIPMKRDTIFDLASLTKPVATTLAVMKLVDEKKLGLDEPLEAILKTVSVLDETVEAVEQLRSLVRKHDVRGKNIHDANVVAVMLTSGLQRLVTYNLADFKRFTEITIEPMP